MTLSRYSSGSFVLRALAAVVLMLFTFATNAAQPPQVTPTERTTLAAGTFRILAAKAPELTKPVLITMPRGLLAKDPALARTQGLAWQMFFSGALVHTGHSQSNKPIFIYYNPYIDVIVASQWQFPAKGSPTVKRICAAPANALEDDPGTTARLPAWLTSKDPMRTLVQNTIATTANLEARFPIKAKADGVMPEKLCSEQRQQQAEFRLLDLLDSMSGFMRSRATTALGGFFKNVKAGKSGIDKAYPKLSHPERELAGTVEKHAEQLVPVVALFNAASKSYVLMLASPTSAQTVLALDLCDCDERHGLQHVALIDYARGHAHAK